MPGGLRGGERGESFRISELHGRFLDQREEDAFNNSHTQKIFNNLSKLLLMYSVIAFPSLLLRAEELSYSWPGTYNFLLVCSLSLYVVTFPLLALLLRVPKMQECMGFQWCEILVVVLMVMVGGREIFNLHLSNSQTALSVDCVVSGVHMFLPIRWSVVLWADVLLVLGFTVRCALVDANEPGAGGDLYLISFLTGLLIAAILGLRTMELSERTLFSTVVDERSLRARAEFDLEQVIGVQTSGRQADVTSQEGSSFQAKSTMSAALFRDMEDNPGMVSTSLQGLAKQEHWLVEQGGLEIFHTEVLGRGGFGLVVKGTYHGTSVAVKMFSSGAGMMDIASEHKLVLNELRVLRRLRHPNIALFFGACLYESPIDQRCDIRLVFELVKGRTLASFATSMHGGRQLPLNGRQVAICNDLLKDVMLAVVYLHKMRPAVVHSDLKPTNIMVQDPLTEPTAKLLDFGISRVVSRSSEIVGGTWGFQAPEIQPGSVVRASPAVDIFAIGRLVEYLAIGRSRGMRAEMRAETHTMLPAEWKTIVETCTSVEPLDRPTATEVHRSLCEGASRTPAAHSAGTPAVPGGQPWGGGPGPPRRAPLLAIQEHLSL